MMVLRALSPFSLSIQQKVLEKWFEDQSRGKAMQLETMNKAFEKERDLLKENQSLKVEVMKAGESMKTLAWQMDGTLPLTEGALAVNSSNDPLRAMTDARRAQQGLQGVPWGLMDQMNSKTSVSPLNLEGITRHVSQALQDSAQLIRDRHLSSSSLTMDPNVAALLTSLDPRQSLKELLENVASTDTMRNTLWSAGTIRAAMEARRNLLELEAVSLARNNELDLQRRMSNLDVDEARQGMALQSQLLHVHLANAASDLQR